MAIVIKKKMKPFIKEACALENLEVVQVATVTEKPSLVMHHNGQTIVDIDREFFRCGWC